MKKKIILLMLASCMVMTACGNQYKEVEVPAVTAETERDGTESSVDVTTDNTVADAAVDDTTSMTIDEPDYYGAYQVTGLRGTAAVYAMSDEEIEAEIGKTLSYGPDSLDYKEASIDLSPEAYEEVAYPADQLYEDFRIRAFDLGITAEEIRAVSILVEGNFFGNYFFIVDTDTLLIYYEGVFFEAKRI